MKKIIISVFCAFLAFSTFAKADEKIEDIKQQILQKLDKQVALADQIREKEKAIMVQFRSCIVAMKNEADFNACNAAQAESYKKLKLELEKSFLDAKEREIASEKKRLNEEMKSTTPKNSFTF